MNFLFTGAHALCSALNGKGGLTFYYVLELLLIIMTWRTIGRLSRFELPLTAAFMGWVIITTGLWMTSIVILTA